MPKSKKVISAEDVKKVAQLSKLDVKGHEKRFAELFNDTLSHIDVLNELDTSNVPETFQVTGLENVFQKDNENKATLSQEKSLSNAGKKERGLVETKGVFENR